MRAQGFENLCVLPTADVKASADEALSVSLLSWFQSYSLYCLEKKKKKKEEEEEKKEDFLNCSVLIAGTMNPLIMAFSADCLMVGWSKSHLW